MKKALYALCFALFAEFNINPAFAQSMAANAAQEAVNHIKLRGCKMSPSCLKTFGLTPNSTASSTRKAKTKLEAAYKICEAGLGKYRDDFGSCVDYLSGR
jgi:hypothetical protein